MEISTSVISRRQTTHTVIPVERHRYWYRLTNSRSGFPSPAPSMNWLRNHNFLVGSGQGQWRKSRERRATFFEIQIDVKGFHFNVWSRKPITRRLASSFSFRRVLHTRFASSAAISRQLFLQLRPNEWIYFVLLFRSARNSRPSGEREKRQIYWTNIMAGPDVDLFKRVTMLTSRIR